VGRVHQLSGRPQRSLTTFQALAATYPPGEEPADLQYWSGIAAASLGRHQKAIDYYLSANAGGLRSADLYYRLAQSHYLLGDRPAAQAALGQAMQIDPHHRPAAQLYQALGNQPRLASVRGQ
jgi:tetratricopeptide (TPR) repeat protein